MARYQRSSKANYGRPKRSVGMFLSGSQGQPQFVRRQLQSGPKLLVVIAHGQKGDLDDRWLVDTSKGTAARITSAEDSAAFGQVEHVDYEDMGDWVNDEGYWITDGGFAVRTFSFKDKPFPQEMFWAGTKYVAHNKKEKEDINSKLTELALQSGDSSPAVTPWWPVKGAA